MRDFLPSAIIVINLKYNHPEVTSWSYAIISIGISCIIGYIISLIHLAIKKQKQENC